MSFVRFAPPDNKFTEHLKLNHELREKLRTFVFCGENISHWRRERFARFSPSDFILPVKWLAALLRRQNKLEGVRSRSSRAGLYRWKNKWKQFSNWSTIKKKKKRILQRRERQEWLMTANVGAIISSVASLLRGAAISNIYFARSRLYRMTNYDSYREYRWISEWHANCQVDLPEEVRTASDGFPGWRNIVPSRDIIRSLMIGLVMGTPDRMDILHVTRY